MPELAGYERRRTNESWSVKTEQNTEEGGLDGRQCQAETKHQPRAAIHGVDAQFQDD